MTALADVNSSGPESLLGVADDLDAQEMRDRLSLATRYLANWYKATSGSENQDVWWARIDQLRFKVESTYNEMTQSANTYFAGKREVADYNDASQSWVDLYNQISLSVDANQLSLLSALPELPSAILQAPGVIIPQIGNELGKIVGGTVGQFLRQTWPLVALAGVGIGAYYGVKIWRASKGKA